MFTKIIHFTKSEILHALTKQTIATTSHPHLLLHPLRFPFSQTPAPQQNITNNSEETLQIENASAKFYKNSIRKVNINDKGRGKFTQHHMLKLIKLVKSAKEQPLLFEAYFNYLGHFTLFESKVIDKMLQKSMSFENCSVSNILDIYQNHNYLAYFPHYNTTNTLLVTLQPHPEHYTRLINILLTSPLIKFNQQIFETLTNQLNIIEAPNNIFSCLSKLIVSRSALNLIQQLQTKRQTLSLLSTAIKARLDNQVFKSTKAGVYFTQWSQAIQESNQHNDQLHHELCIVGSYFQQSSTFGDNLVQIKKEDLVINALLFLEKSHAIFQKRAVEYLQTLQISESLRARVNELKEKNAGQPAATQTQ